MGVLGMNTSGTFGMYEKPVHTNLILLLVVFVVFEAHLAIKASHSMLYEES